MEKYIKYKNNMNNKNIIQHSKKISDAMSKLDKLKVKTLIVTKNNNLLGTITDGDIRRFFLKSGSIDDCVENACNKDCKYISFENFSKKNIDLKKYKDIKIIPVVKNKEVVNLIYLDHFNNNDFVIVINSGGLGTRLRPLTNDCPKPMLDINSKPFLQHSFENFRRQGFKNFIVVTHFMPEKIQQFFEDGSSMNINIKYINEDEPLNTGGCLGLINQVNTHYPIVLINGDIYSKIDINAFINNHINNASDLSICVNEYTHQVPFGVIETNEDKVHSILEKPTKRFLINAGIYCINESVIKLVKTNESISMPDIIERALNKKLSINVYRFHDYWIDIGSFDDLDSFKKAIRTFND